MDNDQETKDAFKRLKGCLVIATFNNAGTLQRVVEDAAKYCSDLLVIDDGSTDLTPAILNSLKLSPPLSINFNFISYRPNRGKGWALRKAFARATQEGYEYALCMDSDGQHFTRDIPAFVSAAESSPGHLIVGSRNMDQGSVLGKSSFGHKFSNFWFRVETAKTCPDTQSGFRLYPLKALEGMVFYTRQYEFKIEVLVRAAWKGVPLDAVDVQIYYAPPETRVSHFRPFRDFSRVSVLNAVLVVIAFA